MDDRTFEKLMTFDPGAAEVEAEPDDEEDGPPVVIDLVLSKVCGEGRPRNQAAWAEPIVCAATIQLKVHGQVLQSIPLDEADIECLIDGLRLVTPRSVAILLSYGAPEFS